MNFTFVSKRDITPVEKVFINEQGLLRVLPYKETTQFDDELMRMFLHVWGIYVLPTTELIDFLKTELSHPAIEIGAGNGAIARALGIPATDSYLQDEPEIKAYYEAMGQPTIKYPRDIIKLDAEKAVAVFKPQTVIGAYITHKFNGRTGNVYGVIEGKILAAGCKYINIGNDTVHADKPILKHPHQTFRFDWLVTRSQKEHNFIKIWNYVK